MKGVKKDKNKRRFAIVFYVYCTAAIVFSTEDDAMITRSQVG